MNSVIKLNQAANGSFGQDAATAGLQDLEDAAYRIAHSYPGGVAALATRMGMSSSTLFKKVSPNEAHHKLSLKEAQHMTLCSGDFGLLHTFAAGCNHVALPMPSIEPGTVHEHLAQLGAEIGDVFREVARVMKDGRVTPNERRRVAGEIAEAMAALAAVYQDLA